MSGYFPCGVFASHRNYGFTIIPDSLTILFVVKKRCRCRQFLRDARG